MSLANETTVTEQLYVERTLLVQLAARLALACGYEASVIPDPDDGLVYVTIGLPTGPVTVGVPPDALRVPLRRGPAPQARQTVRQRSQSLAAFLAASS